MKVMSWFSSCIFNGEKASQDLSIQGIDNVKIYSYEELSKATRDFSSNNRVGEDTFGSIYKGTLKDGTVVAVKVMSNYSTWGTEEFFTGIKVIHDTSHENLVRFYGCCVKGDRRILIYDHFMNGSLADALHGKNRGNSQLMWRRRATICIGVARGLAFLHGEVQPRVIHGDIHAANIFLDSDFTPKISNFHLAKLLPEGESHVSGIVAGTYGYAAPDYIMTGQLRPSTDVYSFGVLLLEIVTGRRAMNINRYEGRHLRERVWTLYECRELSTIVDASVTDEAAADIEEACRYLKVGLLCTQANFDLRPTMSAVLEMLACKMDVGAEQIAKDNYHTVEATSEAPNEASDEVLNEARE